MATRDRDVGIRRVVFDSAAIAAALHVPRAMAEAKFRDGRVAGQWGELWAASLFDFVVHGHANVPATDGAVQASALGDLGVSVKSLTRKGVKFQQSKYQGVGRRCSQADLIDSIGRSDRHLVVDIRSFPTVDFLVLPAAWLLGKAYAERLKPAGWRADQLYDELERDGLLGPVRILDMR